MWCRRCVSPVVGSIATAGVLRWSCERCMPRRDGDFLFCWTAMSMLLWLSMLALHHAAQARKRRTCRAVMSLWTRFTILMPRRVRQRENQLVLHQVAYRHFFPRDHAARRLGGHRIGVDLRLRRSQHQQLVRVDLARERTEAALAAKLQRRVHLETQAGTPTLVAHAAQRVRRFALVGNDYVLEARKAAQRQRSFLRRSGRCEFEAVDHRLVRHKGADDIIVRIPASKQS